MSRNYIIAIVTSNSSRIIYFEERDMVREVCAMKRALALFYRDNANLSYREVAIKCGISTSTAHRICNLKENSSESRKKAGRPKLLNERMEKMLLRTFQDLRRKSANFSVSDLISECGFDPKTVHRRTISRYLNNNGFKLRQARKKGLLNEYDKRLRTFYARGMRKILRAEPHFFTNHVAFYLDAVSFVHKNDPRKAAIQPKSRVWRTKGEGLSITTKGSKSLAGGKRVHVLVAVAYSKGVILKEVYEKMDGAFFAEFIKTHFNLCFGKAGPKAYGRRLFLMDNDPCQTSKKALSALVDIECDLHRIPPRSPDLNPIENVFHLVKKKLEREAIHCNITKESFDRFKERVLHCFESFDANMIDRIIDSMPKRIEKTISSKGKRINY